MDSVLVHAQRGPVLDREDQDAPWRLYGALHERPPHKAHLDSPDLTCGDFDLHGLADVSWASDRDAIAPRLDAEDFEGAVRIRVHIRGGKRALALALDRLAARVHA